MKKTLAYLLFSLLLIILASRLFVLSVWNVPGWVMYPTIHVNQKVLVLAERWFKPKRGDVIIIRSEREGRFYVRRIIGVGGDTLAVRSNVVTINGEVLIEEYKNIDTKRESCDYPDIVSQVVPLREYFVMGDNRCARSDLDSRRDGTILEDQIHGKVIYVF